MRAFPKKLKCSEIMRKGRAATQPGWLGSGVERRGGLPSSWGRPGKKEQLTQGPGTALANFLTFVTHTAQAVRGRQLCWLTVQRVRPTRAGKTVMAVPLSTLTQPRATHLEDSLAWGISQLRLARGHSCVRFCDCAYCGWHHSLASRAGLQKHGSVVCQPGVFHCGFCFKPLLEFLPWLPCTTMCKTKQTLS